MIVAASTAAACVCRSKYCACMCLCAGAPPPLALCGWPELGPGPHAVSVNRFYHFMRACVCLLSHPLMTYIVHVHWAGFLRLAVQTRRVLGAGGSRRPHVLDALPF